jgi:predicted nuclease of restriction endonuclease-like (RecB) superfamily
MQILLKEKYAFFFKNHQSLPISRHLFADSSPEVTPFAETFISKAIAPFVETFNLADTSKRCHLLCRNFQFKSTYPQIAQSPSEQLSQFGINSRSIRQSPTDKLQINDYQSFGIVHSPNAQFDAPISPDLQVPPEKLIARLSFTHLVQLLPISEPLKRTFYEIECMKGNWSVSELKRQINSLYFERSGMSKHPEKLSRIVQENAEALLPADIIKSPFTFEFLGLKAKDVVYESDLEQALIDNLEAFLLELGHGFCFEAKQKRILIGDQYYFIDLVFYHRVLKCHVLIDLKMKAVAHENIGQLKTYIHYYKKHILLPGDNPPVALLLVTENDEALVEYAVADSDQQLFVSKYVLELPSTQQLADFIRKELSS